MSYAQTLADRYNNTKRRNDIEWSVDGNGHLYLHDASGYTAWKSKHIETQTDIERQRMKAETQAAERWQD
jgi:hypothetical protein